MNDSSSGDTTQDMPHKQDLPQTMADDPVTSATDGDLATDVQADAASAAETSEGATEETPDLEETPDSEETPDLEKTPEQKLEEAMEAVAKFQDLALRAEAEMQNLRRRTQRDIENAHKYGLERFLQNLLPVLDSLDKAIEPPHSDTQTEGEQPILEGVRLCHKLLLDTLAKEQVVIIEPEGAPFDPNEHEAIAMVEHQDMEPNSVVTVVQKGYKLNNRLVRPATVMVSKLPEADADASTNEDDT